jgi:hypothetical protein
MAAKRKLIPVGRIAQRILFLRGQKVILDSDLADLYGIETRALKQTVRRNRNRFPDDFLFELSAGEVENVVSQFVIPNRRKFGGAVPMAFTEQGIAMLSSVRNSFPSGERTRFACWRGRPRHRGLVLLRNRFSARRRTQHARRVCSPIQTIQ